MNKYCGKTAYPGIAIGEVMCIKKRIRLVERLPISDLGAEIRRVKSAMEITHQELQNLYDQTAQELGKTNAAIFEVQQMMMNDEDFQDSIFNIIKQQMVNAEYAIFEAGADFARLFSGSNDEYMKERAADVNDLTERILKVLYKETEEKLDLPERCIIVADDLTPSETLKLDRERVVAFVIRLGAANSHTAVLARAMNIPALFKVPFPEDVVGKTAIVNGFDGYVVFDPDEQEIAAAKLMIAEADSQKKTLAQYKGHLTETGSGKRIKLYANIGGLLDLEAALENDAEGIGLFRSEFLFLERNDFPTEEEQYQVYRKVAKAMAGKMVIIRTLDIGADKQIDYFKLPPEENPAMGNRAIRICLKREDIFKTQLRALYRASAYGNIAVMIPMIISLWELCKVKELIDVIKNELAEESKAFGDVKLGIMIETPAAVMIADELAAEVDFFSIGTNDLSQYVLAIDRQNANLDKFFDPRHPAIMKMIRMTIEAGHKAGIWVGICGELGADLEITAELIEMGIDEISVSPAMVLPIRKRIREIQ